MPTVENASNGRRVAKNTALLYVRMILMIIIGLYTSRVVLQVLGVEDFGVYHAVGGVVAMMGILTSSLSAAISRYLTFELGKGNLERLKLIFSTSINVQVIMSLVVIIVSALGLGWFLNEKMTIPADRMVAANWVLYCSILTFAVNLLSVPYNAAIVAHEHMGVFAYISILEAVLKLAIVYALYVSPFDKLKTYAILMLAVAVVIRFIYGVYCKRHYEECRYHFVLDKSLLKEMTGFAGWNFLSNAAWMLNTQGISVLINVFFGVIVSAARGIAGQVEGVVLMFVNNFMTALSPQITKTYAQNDFPAMHALICRGARFSFYLMLLFAIPICIETEAVLKLWLGENVPADAVTFVRLTFLTSMCTVLGNTLVTAQLATGKIRNYQIVMTACGVWVFPLSWLAYELVASAYWTYIIYFVIYFGLIFVRIYMVKDLISMSWRQYVVDVVLKCVIVTILASLLPAIVRSLVHESQWSSVLIVIGSLLSAVTVIYLFGMSTQERDVVAQYIHSRFHKA